MSDKLKPCPFCGGEAELERTYMNAFDTHWQDGWTVYCKKCGAKPAICDYTSQVQRNDEGEIVVIYDGRQQAIKHWNRRVENER